MMKLTTIFHSIVLLSCLSLLNSCKDLDFGEKTLDYVQNHASKDSENLVDKDLKVRFHNAIQNGALEILYRANVIDKTMNDYLQLFKTLDDKNKALNEKDAAYNRSKERITITIYNSEKNCVKKYTCCAYYRNRKNYQQRHL
ncbi:MAG: hypothetical protein HQK50_14880 [Oligoflexia bacterium]|nr:hypothetical protein [Oligoflexia bacterium]MBF0366856.1 hypothetical protein [Oligoflexia bacterium]